MREEDYSGFGRVLWVPSQSGGLPVCLHWHHQTVFFSASSNFTGCSPVPLWEPSQNGWCAERPQEHHQWTPASTSSASGFVSQTIGFSDIGMSLNSFRTSARDGNLESLGMRANRAARRPFFDYRYRGHRELVRFLISLCGHVVKKRDCKPSHEDDRGSTDKFTNSHRILRKCLSFPLAFFPPLPGKKQPQRSSGIRIAKGIVVIHACD